MIIPLFDPDYISEFNWRTCTQVVNKILENQEMKCPTILQSNPDQPQPQKRVWTLYRGSSRIFLIP